jgi:hypothetical protein
MKCIICGGTIKVKWHEYLGEQTLEDAAAGMDKNLKQPYKSPEVRPTAECECGHYHKTQPYSLHKHFPTISMEDYIKIKDSPIWLFLNVNA